MSVGTIIRFDEVRGYGFIAPVGGGEDVFVHVNDFGEHRELIQVGLRVAYEVAEGDRGLKVASLTVLDQPSGPRGAVAPAATPRAAPAPKTEAGPAAAGDDLADCDVLSSSEFTVEATELLIQRVPSLTGAQIAQIRDGMLKLARSHGWVD